jgi:hypothetical protein
VNNEKQNIFNNIKNELLKKNSYVINVKLEKDIGKQLDKLTLTQRYKILTIRPRLFKYIKNPTKREMTIGIVYCQSIKHLSHLFNEEYKIQLLKQNPYYITDFSNPSVKLQLIATKKDPKIILDIQNPSIKIIKTVLKNNPKILIDLTKKGFLDDDIMDIALKQNPWLLNYIESNSITLNILTKYLEELLGNGQKEDYTLIHKLLKLATVDPLVLDYIHRKVKDSKIKDKIKKHKNFQTEAQVVFNHFKGNNEE